MIELVWEVYRQDFVFTCKDSSHKASRTDSEHEKKRDLHIKTERKGNVRHGELYQWEYSNEIVTSWGEKGVPVNWFALRVRHEITNEELYYNSWITSITASDWNIEELCQIGRARWKIENEGFNILKKNGYHLEHNFGHGKAGLANYLSTLNLLAFLVHTYQALTGRIYQAL
jgi:hypothetical protein